VAEAQEPVAASVPLDPEAQARATAAIRERIASGRAELPPLPAIALEVSQMARGDDVDVAKLTSVANRDPALAGQILRVANSPLWSPREPIVSLQQAVARMGGAAVANVAFLVAAKGAGFQAGLKPEEAAAEWRHALLAGCFAKEIARVRRAGVESAFLCGLLHDIGRPIFLREWALAVPGAPPPPLGDGEDVTLHVEAGVALVRAWGLPETFVDAVGGHHADNFAGRDGAATVNLADRMALAALSDGFAAKEFVGDQAALALNLYPDDVAAVWDRRERLMQTAAALR
jgi:putative nucleotidyltransferase with HDIG domain